MQMFLVVFLFLSARIVIGDQGIGGCVGTQYGCCPDGVTPAKGLGLRGCPQRHIAKSAECQAFLKKLPISCDTRTSCQDLECNDTIAGIVDIHIEVDVHKCREPPSVNITLQLNVLGFRYSWSHEFIGNVSLFLPNFNLTIDGLPAPVEVIVEAEVYRRSNRDIHVSAAIEPVLLFSTGNVSRLFIIDFLNDDKYPVNTSDCYGPANCYGNCSNSCLLGDDGWVCYDCPSSCLPGNSSQPVCGSDLVSYNSECSMRLKGCNDSRALRVLYPGSCSSTPPLTVLTEWPKSLDNLPPVTQLFIRVAVVFLSVSVPEKSVSNYTSSYFSDKLSDVLGYQVVVPEIVTSTRTRRDTDGWLTLNVTLYAHYHINSNNSEVVIRNTKLLVDIQKHQAILEMNLKVQNLSASLSYGAQPILVGNTTVHPSTTTMTSVSTAQSPPIKATASSLFQPLTLTSTASVPTSQPLGTQIPPSPSTILPSSTGATATISTAQPSSTVSTSQPPGTQLLPSPSTILPLSTGATATISTTQPSSTVSTSQPPGTQLPPSPSTILPLPTGVTPTISTVQPSSTSPTASASTGQILFTRGTAGIETAAIQSSITTATAKVSSSKAPSTTTITSLLIFQRLSTTTAAKVSSTTIRTIQSSITTAPAKVSSSKAPSTTTITSVLMFQRLSTTAAAKVSSTTIRTIQSSITTAPAKVSSSKAPSTTTITSVLIFQRLSTTAASKVSSSQAISTTTPTIQSSITTAAAKVSSTTIRTIQSSITTAPAKVSSSKAPSTTTITSLLIFQRLSTTTAAKVSSTTIRTIQSSITTAPAKVSSSKAPSTTTITSVLMFQRLSTTAAAKVSSTTIRTIQSSITTAPAKVSSSKAPSTTTITSVLIFQRLSTTAAARVSTTQPSSVKPTSTERLQTGQALPMYTKRVTESLSTAQLSSVTADTMVSATQLPTTTTASHSPSSQSSSIPTKTIIIVVVAVLGGLVAIAIIVVVLWYWRNKRSSYDISKGDVLTLSDQDQLIRESYADENTTFSKDSA